MCCLHHARPFSHAHFKLRIYHSVGWRVTAVSAPVLGSRVSAAASVVAFACGKGRHWRPATSVVASLREVSTGHPQLGRRFKRLRLLRSPPETRAPQAGTPLQRSARRRLGAKVRSIAADDAIINYQFSFSTPCAGILLPQCTLSDASLSTVHCALNKKPPAGGFCFSRSQAWLHAAPAVPAAFVRSFSC